MAACSNVYFLENRKAEFYLGEGGIMGNKVTRSNNCRFAKKCALRMSR
jgi:hypothetical protein